MTRAGNVDRSRSSRRRSRIPSDDPSPPPPIPEPPLEPPPLTPAYGQPPMLQGIPEPPDTPPPLTQAYPTLPPHSAPAYPQQSAYPTDRGPTTSSRSSPDGTYRSPVSYPHSSLEPPQPTYGPYHSEDSTYPSSSHASRAPSTFGRPPDSRWGAYQSQGEQSYPPSESDRYSPVSPATTTGHYTEPPSPAESYHHHGHVQVSAHPSQSYYNAYPPAPRQGQSVTAVPSSASPVPMPPSQQLQSSYRHSIAHISNPQHHSPTSTNPASPAASDPQTPAYGYVPQSMGNYADSPPESLSPVTPAQHSPAIVYNSYESNSLASAGYAHPASSQSAPAHSQSHSQEQSHSHAYDRTLPALTTTHPHGAETPSQVLPVTHFNYNTAHSSYHSAPSSVSTTGPGAGAMERYNSPLPVLAPIQDMRVMRGDQVPGPAPMRYQSSPQPTQHHHHHHQQAPAAMQPPMSRPEQHHTFSYPPQGHSHSPPSSAHAHGHVHSLPTPVEPAASYGYGNAHASTSAHQSGSFAAPPAPSTGYYTPSHHQTHAHGQHGREPSPEAEQYLELHQPQPTRVTLPPPGTTHQYMQPSEVLAPHGHASAHVARGVWRAETQQFRNPLVQ
ncbi:uncharacterized protein BXZ73DRAFT_43711 [Epithele typhae]|uniref:uncharacterized protein n=1 Tax=Epithele typhae TaxID=378194 RepID=UPI00200870B3|nr:uncharacterized protein BXZ73DRAFT_43711 [Epithele typhae]KAH9939417.1 hypothetical protein BXZ73DRAFT_43711 [Epithele typhae]